MKYSTIMKFPEELVDSFRVQGTEVASANYIRSMFAQKPRSFLTPKKSFAITPQGKKQATI